MRRPCHSLLACLLVLTACFKDDSGGDAGDDGGGSDATSNGDDSGSGDGADAGDDGDSGGSQSGGSADSTSGTGGGSADATSSEDSSADAGTTTAGDCSPGHYCVDPIPPGWSGLLIRHGEADPSALPECGGAYPDPGPAMVVEPNGAPAQCSMCQCGDPMGVQCLPPKLRFFENSNCYGTFASDWDASPPGQCKVFAQATGSYGAESDPVTAVPGTGMCPPSGGTPTRPPVTWNTTVRGCSAAGPLDTCGGDGLCAPAPESGFDPGVCIWRDGDVSCPPGGYAERFLAHTGVEDTRDCTPCACGMPGGAQCDTRIQFHFNGSCSDPYVSIEQPGQECITLWGEPPSSGTFEVEGVIGGSCAAGGGQPTGSIRPTDPVTMCCTK